MENEDRGVEGSSQRHTDALRGGAKFILRFSYFRSHVLNIYVTLSLNIRGLAVEENVI